MPSSFARFNFGRISLRFAIVSSARFSSHNVLKKGLFVLGFLESRQNRWVSSLPSDVTKSLTHKKIPTDCCNTIQDLTSSVRISLRSWRFFRCSFVVRKVTPGSETELFMSLPKLFRPPELIQTTTLNSKGEKCSPSRKSEGIS